MTTTSCEERIRSAPLASIGVAIGAGVVLSRLPVLGILGLAIRAAVALVRPTLLILGGAKAWDLIQRRRADLSQAAPENHF